MIFLPHWTLHQPDDTCYEMGRDIRRPEWPRRTGARLGRFPAHLNEVRTRLSAACPSAVRVPQRNSFSALNFPAHNQCYWIHLWLGADLGDCAFSISARLRSSNWISMSPSRAK